MATIEQTCSQCSKTFNRTRKQVQSNLNRGQTTAFCGPKCFNDHQRGSRVCLVCTQCGASVARVLSAKRSPSGNTFCTKSCAAKYNNAHKTKGTRRSKLEVWLEERLREVYPDLDLYCNRRDAINGELDFFFPSLKLAFELNGILHHEPIYGLDRLAKIQNNDARKFQACLERGIELCVVDTERFTYFKAKGAEKFLTLFEDVINRVIQVRLGEDSVVCSSDPTRGRLTPPPNNHPPMETKPQRPLLFKAALALEQAMRWQEDVGHGMTHAAIGTRDGFSQVHVTRVLGLLRLPEETKRGLLERSPLFGALSTKGAMELVETPKKLRTPGLEPGTSRL